MHFQKTDNSLEMSTSQQQNEETPQMNYFIGKAQSKINPTPNENTPIYKRSNSTNYLSSKGKKSIITFQKKDQQPLKLITCNPVEPTTIKTIKCYTEQDTQTTNSNIFALPPSSSTPKRIVRLSQQMPVQPKNIQLNVNQSLQVAQVYYAQNIKSLLASPRYQISQSEKNYVQKLNLLNNQNQKMKQRESIQNSPMTPQIARPASQYYRIVKKDTSQLNLQINSRKNSRLLVSAQESQSTLPQQTEWLDQNNLHLTKSQSEIQQSVVSSISSPHTNNNNSNQPPLKLDYNSSIFKKNVNPVTRQIEVHGSSFSQQSKMQENPESNYSKGVLKNEFVASRLTSSEILQDRTQMNEQHLLYMIYTQKQVQSTFTSAQHSHRDLQNPNEFHDKEQQENQRKYFELIRDSMKDIEKESNNISYNDFQMDTPSTRTQLRFEEQQNSKTNNQTTLNSNRISQYNNEQYPELSCPKEQQEQMEKQQFFDEIKQSFNDQFQLSKQSTKLYNKYRTILTTSNTTQRIPTKQQTTPNIPFKSVSKLIQMNSERIQSANQNQKLDFLMKQRKRNQILNQCNFDYNKYKQMQIQIEKTQNRLFNNNYL